MNWIEFATVAVVHLLAVASPGPDFAVVVRQSVRAGLRSGTLTALGIGCGNFLHVSYSLLGIGLVIAQSVLVFNILKWLAAGYLFYLGIKALRARAAVPGSTEESTPQQQGRRAFVLGFMTCALNPKATLFFLSLFAVVISPQTPTWARAGYGVYLTMATTLWFCLVARLFSLPQVRTGFARLGHWFDRATGAVLVGLGLQLAFSQWRG